MYRNIINDFANWYDQTKRKILYVKGAKGVGKTWAVRDFATAFFKQQCYINLAEDSACQDAIAGDSNLDLLLSQRFPFGDASDCIFIFDEVQAVPDCAEFFYAFRKNHPDYTICLIASSMEFTEFEYSHPDVFEIFRMRPMTFEEYMIASKAHPFIDAISKHKDTPLTNLEIGAITSMLREYLLVGRSPCVSEEPGSVHHPSDAGGTVGRLCPAYETDLPGRTLPAMQAHLPEYPRAACP